MFHNHSWIFPAVFKRPSGYSDILILTTYVAADIHIRSIPRILLGQNICTSPMSNFSSNGSVIPKEIMIEISKQMMYAK